MIHQVGVWDGTYGAKSPCVLIRADAGDFVWRHTITGQRADGSPAWDSSASKPVRSYGASFPLPAGEWFDTEVAQQTLVGYGTTRDSIDAGTLVSIPDSGVWLVPVDHPELSAPLLVEQHGFSDFVATTTQAVVKVPGRANPLTVDFGRSNPASTLTTLAMTGQQAEMLRTALDCPGGFFLSFPVSHWPGLFGEPYVTIGDATWTPSGTVANPRWTVQLPLTPCDRPIETVRSQRAGFAGLPDSFATLESSYATIGAR